MIYYRYFRGSCRRIGFNRLCSARFLRRTDERDVWLADFGFRMERLSLPGEQIRKAGFAGHYRSRTERRNRNRLPRANALGIVSRRIDFGRIQIS